MTLTPDAIREIATALQQAGLAAIELEEGETRLRILARPGTGTAAAPALPRPATAAPPTDAVNAPASGIFLDRHPARTAPFAEPGAMVTAGMVIGLLQTGPIHRAVTAPRDGRLGEALTPPGTLVGYGTKLFRLD